MSSKKTIVVVGGSGYAGSAIAREAAKRGHSVTSVSRSIPPDKSDGISYIAADALNGTLDIGKADVVVGALSHAATMPARLPKHMFGSPTERAAPGLVSCWWAGFPVCGESQARRA